MVFKVLIVKNHQPVILFMLFIHIFFSIACSSKKKIDYSKVGENLCSCSTKVNTLNEKLKELIDKKQTEKIMILMDTMALAENDLKSCILKENKEVNFLGEENSEKSLHKVLEKKCPDRAAKILELTSEMK